MCVWIYIFRYGKQYVFIETGHHQLKVPVLVEYCTKWQKIKELFTLMKWESKTLCIYRRRFCSPISPRKRKHSTDNNVWKKHWQSNGNGHPLIISDSVHLFYYNYESKNKNQFRKRIFISFFSFLFVFYSFSSFFSQLISFHIIFCWFLSIFTCSMCK